MSESILLQGNSLCAANPFKNQKAFFNRLKCAFINIALASHSLKDCSQGFHNDPAELPPKNLTLIHFGFDTQSLAELLEPFSKRDLTVNQSPSERRRCEAKNLKVKLTCSLYLP